VRRVPAGGRSAFNVFAAPNTYAGNCILQAGLRIISAKGCWVKKFLYELASNIGGVKTSGKLAHYLNLTGLTESAEILPEGYQRYVRSLYIWTIKTV
jgi:hypothetical protein